MTELVKRAASAASAATAAATAAKRKGKQAMQVSVVVRVRPLLPHEKHQPLAVRVTRAEKRNQPSLVTLSPSRDGSSSTEPPVDFAFEKCYDGDAPQRLLFQREIAQSVTGVLAGVNTTVFAYGATGAGKTFTMEGSKKNLGMIPRCVKQLFQVAEESRCTFQIELSYLEIYNDRIRDLLVAKAQKMDLPIRQQVDGTISVHGLTKKRVTTLLEFEALYEKGSAGRKKARTELNTESSRSHSILMLHVRTTDDASGEVRSGKLHLIDLAGCEDNRRTGNSGARLAESGKINMSLFVLGKVITALNAGDIQRIPFRDSKLTRLLQDSLGGSSHAIMICNVSPVASMYQETLQTLTYASKARGIVNDVVINRAALTPVTPTPTPSVGSTAAAPAREDSRRTSLLPKPPGMTAIAPLKPGSEAAASRLGKSPAPATVAAPRSSVGSSRAMESKLAAWRESKNQSCNNSSSSARSSIIDVKSANVRGGSALGLKRKATSSIGEPKLTPTASIPSSAPASATSLWSRAVLNSHSSKPTLASASRSTPSFSGASSAAVADAPGIPEPKKSRLSVSSSPSVAEVKASVAKESWTPTSSAPVQPAASSASPSTRPSALPSDPSASSADVVARAAPEPTRSRLSAASSVSSREAKTPVAKAPGVLSSATALPEPFKKSPICTGSPASDKENQPAPPANARTISEDEKPVLIAKKLIGLAIDLERKRRFSSAFCLFQRAYHVLPAENVKLVQRMRLLLEGECPEATALVPSQQMATVTYVRVVMERDLLEVLNCGSTDQLLELHSIGDKRAERIVEARPFSQLSDLLRVQGITDKVLQKLHAQHTSWENPA